MNVGDRIHALGRLKSGAMNKTEEAYAGHLEMRRRAGDVAWFRFEGLTLKLAPDCRYTPDFAVMLADGRMEAHEVKGFWRDDAKVKIRIAAAEFPLRFIAIKKAGSGWSEEEF